MASCEWFPVGPSETKVNKQYPKLTRAEIDQRNAVTARIMAIKSMLTRREDEANAQQEFNRKIIEARVSAGLPPW